MISPATPSHPPTPGPCPYTTIGLLAGFGITIIALLTFSLWAPYLMAIIDYIVCRISGGMSCGMPDCGCRVWWP